MKELKFCYLKRLSKEQNTQLASAIARKGRYWEPDTTLRVFFIGGEQSDIDSMKETIEYMLSLTSLKVQYVTAPENSDIRISFKRGYGSYSYLGTDCKLIPKTEETLNLGWRGKDVERHEFGHTLNLFHEHQNPKGGIQWNEEQVIKDLSGAPNYWTEDQIRRNVLDPINLEIADATTFDPKSVMLYSFPPEWTLNGFTGEDNVDLSETDKAFLTQKYASGRDTVAPTLEIVGNDTIKIWTGQVYEELGARAVDDKDGDITDKIEIVNNINIDVPGTYKVIYSVQDSAGNETIKVRTVVVEDWDGTDEEESKGCLGLTLLFAIILFVIGGVLGYGQNWIREDTTGQNLPLITPPYNIGWNISVSEDKIQNFDYYSVGYNEEGTQWCTYRLTQEMIDKDQSRERPTFKSFNGFTTNSYTNSGYDRGHLAPADHFSFNEQAYNDTFSLANVVPMKPELNRQVWKWLEIYEKRLAEEYDCINVVIKIKYSGSRLTGGLGIPSRFIRIIESCNGDLIAQYEFLNL